jgi:tetratricopeptide (TPR) repeat protein
VLGAFLNVTEYGAAEARELARIYQNRGRLQQATDLLVRSFDSEPYDLQARHDLGDLYLQLGDGCRAANEFQAALALDPVEIAELYFDQARSLAICGDARGAKRAVLKSLEEAPGFRDAQRFLLTLVEGQ